MRPESPPESDKLAGKIDPPGDRYEVREGLDARKKCFNVIDKHRANAVVGSYPTFRQASIECTFLCLLHLKSTHAPKTPS